MYELFNYLVTFFLSVPDQIYVLILGSAGVSVLSQVFKKALKIENERWVFSIVMVVALLGSVLDWLLTNNGLPPTIIGVQTSLLVGIAQPIYFYVIKPLNMVIAGYKANKAALEAKVNGIETATVPAGSTTLENAANAVGELQKAATTANTTLAPATPSPAVVTPTPVQGAIAFEETPAPAQTIAPVQPEPARPVADF